MGLNLNEQERTSLIGMIESNDYHGSNIIIIGNLLGQLYNNPTIDVDNKVIINLITNSTVHGKQIQNLYNLLIKISQQSESTQEQENNTQQIKE